MENISSIVNNSYCAERSRLNDNIKKGISFNTAIKMHHGIRGKLYQHIVVDVYKIINIGIYNFVNGDI